MGNTRRFCIVTLLAVLAFGTAAKAEDSPFWSRSGEWEIRVDPSLNHGCFAVATYEVDTMLRIGLDPGEGDGYVVIGDPDWQSLEEGKSYPIRVQFGRAAPWEADATAGRMDGFPVLFFRFRDLNVVREFMRKREVAFIYRNKTIAVLSLSGSFRAFQEVIRCQEQVNAGLIDSGTDPFSGGSGRRFGYGDDPFR